VCPVRHTHDGRSSHDAALQRWELLAPTVVVGGVGALVDVARPRTDLARVLPVCVASPRTTSRVSGSERRAPLRETTRTFFP